MSDEDTTSPGTPRAKAKTAELELERVRIPTPSGSRRVPPNEHKPRLSPRKEAALAEADAKSAEGYDALESAGEMVAVVRQAIEDGAVCVELELSDSTVITLGRLLR